MSNKKHELAAVPDEENPEWTAQDFAAARPALDVVAEVFGAPAAALLRRGRGRPPKEDRKVNQTLRLDPDVLEAYRTQGSGWRKPVSTTCCGSTCQTEASEASKALPAVHLSR